MKAKQNTLDNTQLRVRFDFNTPLDIKIPREVQFPWFSNFSPKLRQVKGRLKVKEIWIIFNFALGLYFNRKI